MQRNLLLISNSTNVGEEYLGWPREIIKSFLDKFGVKKVLFVPYAGVTSTYDAYTEKVRMIFKTLGFELESVHQQADPVKAVEEAEAVVVGGGNTFSLVDQMHHQQLMKAVRKRALEGMPYMGWSAGSNVACPTMKTTNDMPIVQPPSFTCLNLIPFQINPHYLDANPEGHGGETREDRIMEFLTANPTVSVVGLREATAFLVKDNDISLLGKRPFRFFRFGKDPEEFGPESDINFLMRL